MVFCSYSSPYLIKYETMKIYFIDFNLVYNRIDCVFRPSLNSVLKVFSFFELKPGLLKDSLFINILQ